jgi:RecA-family ATPase
MSAWSVHEDYNQIGLIDKIAGKVTTLVSGDEKAGKTIYCCQAVASHLRGFDLFSDMELTGQRLGKILFCAVENDCSKLLEIFSNNYNLSPAQMDNLILLDRRNFGLKPLFNFRMVKRFLSNNNIDIVVLDLFEWFHDGGTDYRKVYEYYRALDELKDKYGCSFITTMHCRKSKTGRTTDWVLGSRAHTGAVDQILYIERGSDDFGYIAGRGREIEDFRFDLRFDRANVRWRLNDSGVSGDIAKGTLLAIADAGRPLKAGQIFQLAKNYDYHTRVIADLGRKGFAVKRGGKWVITKRGKQVADSLR